MVGGADSAVSTCRPLFDALSPSIGAAPRTNDTDGYILYPEEYGWIYAGPLGAGHFVKMVHNGIEYGIMQVLYAEGFNILHELMLGQFMLKRAMLRLLRWRIRKIIVTTLMLLKWLSVGGAVALLGLGYLTLLRMYYAGIENLVTSRGRLR